MQNSDSCINEEINFHLQLKYPNLIFNEKFKVADCHKCNQEIIETKGMLFNQH